MKKKIAVYWPMAIVVPLALAACLNLFNQSNMQPSQAPLAADRVSAELARTVSYGFVGVEAVLPADTLRVTAAMPAQAL